MNALLADNFSEVTVIPSVVVCGFEAFINGKHIIGEVKEKEQAHKEYREAISQGHGAYLMDEETPVRSFILLHAPCHFGPVFVLRKKFCFFVCFFCDLFVPRIFNKRNKENHMFIPRSCEGNVTHQTI